jgi:hypothetical protein
MESKNIDKVLYENDILYIPVDMYKKMSQCNVDFTGSHIWDEACGLDFIVKTSEEHNKVGYLPFHIVDMKKFFFAKIKYSVLSV